jgi:hypothetical protein
MPDTAENDRRIAEALLREAEQTQERRLREELLLRAKARYERAAARNARPDLQ